jgi:hypothetical protein
MNAEDVRGICRRLMGKDKTKTINGALLSTDGIMVTVSYIHPDHWNTIRVRIQKKDGHKRAKTFKTWQSLNEVRNAIAKMIS